MISEAKPEKISNLLQCTYYQQKECRSCTLINTPYEQQLLQKNAQITTLIPAKEWLPPAASQISHFRNKVKLAVSGSVRNPKLGIINHDLRDCPLPTPGIRNAITVLAEFVQICELSPYNFTTNTGVLKYILITESSKNELMVRFVVRRRGVQGIIFKRYDWLQNKLPQLRVCSINIQPERKAIIEGAEEILVSARKVLSMPLEILINPAGRIENPDAGNAVIENADTLTGKIENANPSACINEVNEQRCRKNNNELFETGNKTESAQHVSLSSAQPDSQLSAHPDPRCSVRSVSPRSGRHALNLSLQPKSFFQTNTLLAQALYGRAASWISEYLIAREQFFLHQNETPARDKKKLQIWDLYCGVGGFALAAGIAANEILRSEKTEIEVKDSQNKPGISSISRSGASSANIAIYGVETSAEAVTGAEESARRHGLPAHFIAADAAEWAQNRLQQGAVPDIVIVNPPRRGIGAEFAQVLNRSETDIIIYSSCNAETLAKDLLLMPSYTVEKAQVLDMFPHTEHAETVVLLVRKMDLASKMD